LLAIINECSIIGIPINIYRPTRISWNVMAIFHGLFFGALVGIWTSAASDGSGSGKDWSNI